MGLNEEHPAKPEVKTYTCYYCGLPLPHDKTFHHTQYECEKRPGSTVKARP